MNLDIRQNIISNFKDTNEKEIRESIESSINEGKEITLPGLGVFFEILWSNSTDDTKNMIISSIKEGL